MKQFFFLAIALSLTAFQCKPDCGCVTPPEPNSTINLNFKAVYNVKPFVINEVVDYNGKKMRITKVSFLSAPIAFQHTQTNLDDLKAQPQLIDFTSTDDITKATKGVNIPIKIFAGNFQSLKIAIGVDSINNAFKPVSFPSSNPLSDAGNYWDDWKSYIFTKFEALIDKDGNGTFETGITLHTGGNQVFRNLTFNKKIDIADSQEALVNFELNINELLKDIDLNTITSTHQASSLPIMQKFTGNFATALTLK